MNWPSHVAYPYLLANSIAWLLGINLTIQQELLLILFSVLPDADYGFHWLYMKMTGRRFNAGVNHHEWSSHWPISYIPLALIFAIWPNTETLLMLFGIISHLSLDTIACNFGIRWGAPFSLRWFNYFKAKAVLGVDSLQWLKWWKSTNFYRVEMVALALVVVHIIAIF